MPPGRGIPFIWRRVKSGRTGRLEQGVQEWTSDALSGVFVSDAAALVLALEVEGHGDAARALLAFFDAQLDGAFALPAALNARERHACFSQRSIQKPRGISIQVTPGRRAKVWCRKHRRRLYIGHTMKRSSEGDASQGERVLSVRHQEPRDVDDWCKKTLKALQNEREVRRKSRPNHGG